MNRHQRVEIVGTPSLTNGTIRFELFGVGDVSVRVFGGAAAVVTETKGVKYRYQDREMDQRSRMSSVFVKRNGRWQKVAEHATRL